MEAIKILHGADLLALVDALQRAKSPWRRFKGILAEAYKEERLYAIRAPDSGLTCRGARTNGLVPCFCILGSGRAIDLIWTDPQVRRRGYGRALVHQLKSTHVNCPLASSLGFWQSCGIVIDPADIRSCPPGY